MIHLPPPGYENGKNLPREPQGAGGGVGEAARATSSRGRARRTGS